jgi:hypothetical protein
VPSRQRIDRDVTQVKNIDDEQYGRVPITLDLEGVGGKKMTFDGRTWASEVSDSICLFFSLNVTQTGSGSMHSPTTQHKSLLPWPRALLALLVVVLMLDVCLVKRSRIVGGYIQNFQSCSILPAD